MSVKTIQDSSSTKFLHPSSFQIKQENPQAEANGHKERQPLKEIALQAFLPVEQDSSKDIFKVIKKYTKKISEKNRCPFNSPVLKPKSQTNIQLIPNFEELSLEARAEHNQEPSLPFITSDQIDQIANDVFLLNLLPYGNNGPLNEDERFDAPLISKEQLKLICKLVNEQIVNPDRSTVTPTTATGRFINIQKSKLKEHEVYKSLPFKIQAYIFSDKRISLYITPRGNHCTGGTCKFFKSFFVGFSSSDSIPLCKWVGRLTNLPRYLNTVQLEASYRCKLEKNPTAATYEHGSYAPYIGKNGTEKFMYLSELCRRGELMDMGDRDKDGIRIRIFCDLIECVHSLHSRNIVHGDIKLENFFVGDSNILIGDYGIRKNSDGSQNIVYTADCNSPEWLEYYQTRNQAILGYPIDIWALGIAFHEIYTEKTPKWCDLFKSVSQFREFFYRFLQVVDIANQSDTDELIAQKNLFIKEIESLKKTLVAGSAAIIASLSFKSSNALKGKSFSDKGFSGFTKDLQAFQQRLFVFLMTTPLSKEEPLCKAMLDFTVQLENKLRECFKILAEEPLSPMYLDSLIQRMLNPDPKKRITIKEIYEEALPKFQEFETQRNQPGKLSFSNGEYEGKLLYTVPHGYGRSRNNEGAVYEGNWLDGCHHGEGKEILADGTVYEGTWLLNNRHGKGRLTGANGEIVEGIWLLGKQHGKATIHCPGGVVLEGLYVNGDLKQGKYSSGDTVYVGEFLGGKFEGSGTVTCKDIVVYEGQWKNNLYHGSGKSYENGVLQYDGDWMDGLFHGKGKRIFNQGAIYEGFWLSGQKSGEGRYYQENGNVYEGSWLQDQLNGQAKLQCPDGTILEGVWVDNKLKHGTQKKENSVYNGDFVANKFEGFGTWTVSDKLVYEGQWKNGLCHGSGKYYKNGILKYDGNWVENKQQG